MSQWRELEKIRSLLINIAALRSMVISGNFDEEEMTKLRLQTENLLLYLSRELDVEMPTLKQLYGDGK